MSGIDISTWGSFWVTFRLPVAMSLLGAVIGHYRKNGVIQFPIVSISYQRGPHLADLKSWFRPLRWVYLFIDFITYVIGLRWDKGRPREAVLIDLGFLGDMLVGVGTGILAKTGLSATNTTSVWATVSTSLLAGFAGLSYIQSMQLKDIHIGTDQRQKQLEAASRNAPTFAEGTQEPAASIEKDARK